MNSVLYISLACAVFFSGLGFWVYGSGHNGGWLYILGGALYAMASYVIWSTKKANIKTAAFHFALGGLWIILGFSHLLY